VIYEIIALLAGGIILGLIGGYFLGHYQNSLLNKIHELENRPEPELPPEPEKPAVTGGAYQPPREISNAPDKKKAAGIVEAKTPQQMEWEAQEELHKLEHSA
jgi:hypothetical protein